MQYQSIQKPTQAIYKEKGSKFLAFAYPVSTEAEIRSILEKVRKEYFDASHHCYAYILGANGDKWRANDDGEPYHSAGTPILQQIKSKNLKDVLVIVVRYFGGIKLGVSGLINAYKTAATLALENAEVCEKTETLPLFITYNYDETSEIMQLIHQHKLTIIDQSFDLFCHATILVVKAEYENVFSIFAKWQKNYEASTKK
ncbi:IMPACT family protein [Raineya orbicola]|jgi:uncharacterized YigZ family protein|uniref:Impact N-terminal domain-containing protein n=1 Tax=Raineya orbicola TaxID=2016530 RepID=A0A2N3I8B3_9BACT|nr:YigZ family protein [Raineya orbicola]PKQ66574.1 hypothetical protein Rain11_2332 [Raineya orbicola]